MFRISSDKTDGITADAGGIIAQANINLLSQFCVVDHWSANLANAMLRLGDRAKAYHSLDDGRDRFGLLEFVRCYDEREQPALIALFERAAFSSTPFHFSAELQSPGAGSRIVHCFGAYRSVEGTRSGEELYGIFLFSRDLYEKAA